MICHASKQRRWWKRQLLLIILDLSHTIVLSVRHAYSDKAEFSFFAKEDRFLVLFQTCTKLKFNLSDILVITVIARDRKKSIGSLFFRERILRFGKICPKVRTV